MKIEYPKFLYHKTYSPRIVYSEAEHLAIGENWFEYPVNETNINSDLNEVKKPKKSKKSAEKKIELNQEE